MIKNLIDINAPSLIPRLDTGTPNMENKGSPGVVSAREIKIKTSNIRKYFI